MLVLKKIHAKCFSAMIDFNGMSTHLELFYVWRFVNCIHCISIYTFLWSSLKFFSFLIFCFNDTLKSSGIDFFKKSVLCLITILFTFIIFGIILFLLKRTKCYPSQHFQISPSYLSFKKIQIQLNQYLEY